MWAAPAVSSAEVQAKLAGAPPNLGPSGNTSQRISPNATTVGRAGIGSNLLQSAGKFKAQCLVCIHCCGKRTLLRRRSLHDRLQSTFADGFGKPLVVSLVLIGIQL